MDEVVCSLNSVDPAFSICLSPDFSFFVDAILFVLRAPRERDEATNEGVFGEEGERGERWRKSNRLRNSPDSQDD